MTLEDALVRVRWLQLMLADLRQDLLLDIEAVGVIERALKDAQIEPVKAPLPEEGK
jgi:hypothetical protein